MFTPLFFKVLSKHEAISVWTIDHHICCTSTNSFTTKLGQKTGCSFLINSCIFYFYCMHSHQVEVSAKHMHFTSTLLVFDFL